MRRILPTPSPLRAASASPHLRVRVGAVLGLFALGLLLGHVHPAEHAEFGFLDTTRVSDDRAHHEHSPHAVFDTAPCVGCRSVDESALPAQRAGRIDLPDAAARTLRAETQGAGLAPFSGLPATRAPPIG